MDNFAMSILQPGMGEVFPGIKESLVDHQRPRRIAKGSSLVFGTFPGM